MYRRQLEASSAIFLEPDWNLAAVHYEFESRSPSSSAIESAICRIRRSDFDAQLFLNETFTMHDATRGLGAFLQHDAYRVRGHFETQRRNGPLFGLPIAVKDNIDVLGYASSAGTPGLVNWFPSQDAEVIQLLVENGATIFGKTGLHELAFGVTSNNRAFGPIHNPYDLSAVPGGSSGGSAVAVAAGVVPLALGTDTAGSCRLPAALCGCVGFRPSLGRYSSDGVVPLAPSQDTIGLLAQTPRDIQFIDRLIGRPLANAKKPLSGARLGIPRRYYYESIDTGVSTVMESALELLRDAGATLVEADLPPLDELVRETLGPIMLYEWPREISVYLSTHRSPIRTWELIEAIAGEREKTLFARQLGARAITTQRYTRLISTERVLLRECFDSYLIKHRLDAIAVPAVPTVAPPMDCNEEFDLNGTRVSLLTLIRNTAPSSIIGWPSITVPAGLTRSKHPVGLMFEGPPGSDSTLIGLASEFEIMRGAFPRPSIGRSARNPAATSALPEFKR